MKSPFLKGIKRGIGISIVLVVFWLLSDFFYFNKLESKNKVNLESKQDVSIGGDFDLIGENANHSSFELSCFLNCLTALNSTIPLDIPKTFASHSPLLLNKEKDSFSLTLITLAR